jgi:hypothetical protein
MQEMLRSESIISSLIFYGYLDRMVDELGLFRGIDNVSKFLLISEENCPT